MTELIKGCFCKSIAGHDKDSIYIIIDVNESVMVADGKYRKLENPKKKNPNPTW